MHAQAVSPLRRWSATIELLPVIAMIIFIKYPLNDQRFKQISDEAEARKRTVIKTQRRSEDLRHLKFRWLTSATERSPGSSFWGAGRQPWSGTILVGGHSGRAS